MPIYIAHDLKTGPTEFINPTLLALPLTAAVYFSALPFWWTYPLIWAFPLHKMGTSYICFERNRHLVRELWLYKNGNQLLVRT